jgi:hypothetical protein
MSNHVERFYAAVMALVAHDDIKQRLISAFEGHLADIGEEELPLALRQDFIALKNAMSCVEPLNGEGKIRATVRKMSVYEADRCAGMMLDLYADLVRLGDELQETIPPVIEDEHVIPAFLVKTGS